MLKTYNFWIRLVAVLVLLLRIVGSEFGFSVDSGLIIDLATAVASVLVVLGVIQVPAQKIDTGAINATNDSEINGGEFMKTFEQIKEDLLKVKEKIESSVAKENTIVGEIGAIIEGLVNDEEVVSEETIIQEEQGVAIEDDEKASESDIITQGVLDGDEVSTDVIIEEGNGEVETIIRETAVEEGVKEADEFEEKLVADAVSSVSEFITEEERSKIDMDKLSDVVREKIATLLASEIDNILHDATI